MSFFLNFLTRINLINADSDIITIATPPPMQENLIKHLQPALMLQTILKLSVIFATNPVTNFLPTWTKTKISLSFFFFSKN